MTLILSILLQLNYIVYDSTDTFEIRIREHSKLSKLTGKELVIGNTIHISGSARQFFSNLWLVNHELQHVKQYRRLGIGEFLRRYIVLGIIFGNDHPMERDPKTIRL